MLLGPPGGSLEVFWWILDNFRSHCGSHFRFKIDFVLHRFLLILLECSMECFHRYFSPVNKLYNIIFNLNNNDALGILPCHNTSCPNF